MNAPLPPLKYSLQTQRIFVRYKGRLERRGKRQWRSPLDVTRDDRQVLRHTSSRSRGLFSRRVASTCCSMLFCRYCSLKYLTRAYLIDAERRKKNTVSRDKQSDRRRRNIQLSTRIPQHQHDPFLPSYFFASCASYPHVLRAWGGNHHCIPHFFI